MYVYVCVHAWCGVGVGFLVPFAKPNMENSKTRRPCRGHLPLEAYLIFRRFYKRDLKWQAFLYVGLSWPRLASFFGRGGALTTMDLAFVGEH